MRIIRLNTSKIRSIIVNGYWRLYGTLGSGWRKQYAKHIHKYSEDEKKWAREKIDLHNHLKTHFPELLDHRPEKYWRWKYYYCKAFCGAVLMLDFFGYMMIRRSIFLANQVLTEGKTTFASKYLNSPEAITLCVDKEKSAKCWSSWYHRGISKISPELPISISELTKLMNGKSRVVIKPLGSYGGKGIFVIDIDVGTEDLEECVRNLNELHGTHVVEEYIEQNGWLHDLNPSSLNTVRVITGKHSNGTIEVLRAALRIGHAGAVVDNFSSGGIAFAIDPCTGVLGYGTDQLGNYLDSHPDSGLRITGQVMPHWEEALDFCCSAHRHAPTGLYYAGWDVSISEDGLCMVEVNSSPGLSILFSKKDNQWKRVKRLLNEEDQRRRNQQK